MITRLEEAIEFSNSVGSLKSLLGGILKKFQIEMSWICQLESMDNIIQTLISYKTKTLGLHQRSLVCQA